MNTKEAIEYLGEQKNSDDEIVAPNRLGINLILDDIIVLLKRGEKFEEIIEGIYRALNPIRAFKSITIQDRSDILRNIQHILEQKYFPKGGSQ